MDAHSHRAALRAEGRSTEEFDRNLTTSVRRYLKDKGLTEAQIDAALAASANPLDAVKPYVSNSQEIGLMEHSAQLAEDRAVTTPRPTTVAAAVALPSETKQPPALHQAPAQDIEDVMATFRAAGVTTSVASASETELVGQSTLHAAVKARDRTAG